MLRRWWWVALILLYKIAEDRMLGEANDEIEGRNGLLPDVAEAVVDVLPYLTWLLVPVTIIVLLWRSYQDSKPGLTSLPSQQPEPVTLDHDGMEWAYVDRNTTPDGPLCPQDHTPLAYVDIRAHGSPVVPYFNPREANLGGYWGFLRCLTCGAEYGKETGYKTVGQSRAEVRRRFEGMENRGEV